jgi:hypothetical protein
MASLSMSDVMAFTCGLMGVDAYGTRYNSCKPLCCIRLIYQFLVPVYHYKKKGVQKSEMFYLII